MTVSYVPGPPPPLEPEEARALTALAREIRALSEPDWRPAVAAALSEWTVIGLAMASTAWIVHPAWWALMGALIGTRQHGLLILMHDAVHRRMHRDPAVNDLISDVLCAWPLLISTEGYRGGHLQHHTALHTPADPDWQMRHDRIEWAWPKPLWRLVGGLLLMGMGGGIAAFLRSNGRLKQMGAPMTRQETHPGRQVARLVVTLALPVGALIAGEGPRFLVLWVVPFLTVLPVVVRLRVIAEHYGLPATSTFDTTRDWTAGKLLDWLLVPWNIRLHLTHHLFAGVPFHRLPQAHRLLRADGRLGPRCHHTPGLGALVRELTGV